jgi:Cft2 family RNA processing exonuclease
VLIDCGLLQGGRDLDEENAEPFGFDAASIDIVLLTHAHLDHCGRLPLLALHGFRGDIITTAATRELGSGATASSRAGWKACMTSLASAVRARSPTRRSSYVRRILTVRAARRAPTPRR